MSTLEWGQNDPPSLTLGLKELNTIHLRIVLFSVCSKVRFDFEEGAASLKDWGRTGTAFNYQPQYGGKIGPKVNRQGDYWITSGDLEQGTLVSPEFEITGLNFMCVVHLHFNHGSNYEVLHSDFESQHEIFFTFVLVLLLFNIGSPFLLKSKIANNHFLHFANKVKELSFRVRVTFSVQALPSITERDGQERLQHS